uniref:(northern house mosquito) hypothetical protein n=1 Tax=Culex pipiens TaxID=7175 RepID=A0A8D8K4Y1_CULPI
MHLVAGSVGGVGSGTASGRVGLEKHRVLFRCSECTQAAGSAGGVCSGSASGRVVLEERLVPLRCNECTHVADSAGGVCCSEAASKRIVLEERRVFLQSADVVMWAGSHWLFFVISEVKW